MRLDSETTVYLTGGTGYLGRHLRSALADRETDMTLLAREETTVEPYENERVSRGDLTDADTLDVTGHDVVVHLAAQTSIETSIEAPAQTWEVNADGTCNLLEATRNADTERFFYTSTASVYGSPESLPTTEAHPTNPREPYGAGKLAGEALARSYGTAYDLSTLVVRPFNTFGPGQPRHNVVPTMVTQALDGETIQLGNLSPSRDFIYVADVVSAFLTVLEDGAAGGVYNVGRGDYVSIGELARMVAELVDHDIDIVSETSKQRSGDVEIPRTVADISRLQSLGWAPEFDIKSGLEATIEAFRSDSRGGAMAEFQSSHRR
jgi:nucleoside-diphosphate-sugar epimerase